jgi:hypothetical protein
VRHSVGSVTVALAALSASLLVGPLQPAAAAGGSISGTVSAEDGRTPVAGLCVAALDPSTGQRAAVTSVANDGGYLLEPLGSGQYVIEYDCGNSSPLVGEFYSNAPSRYGAEPLQIDGDTAVTGIDATLATSAGLAGTVTAQDGRLLPGVCVYAGSPGHTGYATSDEQGRWRTEGLIPGFYTVYLFPCEGQARAWLPKYFGGAQRESDARQVEVRAGEAVEGLDESLLLGAIVTARGVDATSGAVLPGCRGDAVDFQGRGDHHIDEPGPDGRFRVLGVPAGDWYFRIGCAGEWRLPGWYQGHEVSLEHGATGSAPLTLRSGDEVEIQVPLTEGGRISGRILDPQASSPPVGCTVRFLDETGRSRDASSPDQGLYRSPPLPAGRYAVEVHGCVGDYARRYHPRSPDAATATWVSVTARQETTGADVELYDGAEQAVRSIEPACPRDRVPYAHFDDVQVGAHRAAVDCVAWWEVARGYGPDYRPDESVRRGQMASFLVRLIDKSGGTLPQSPPDAFADDNGHAHEQSVNALAELGILRGNAGRVLPDAPVDRAQMASFLMRVINYRIDAQLSVSRDHFSDDAGSVHEDAINAVADALITAGRADGSYGPADPVRRLQMASFLARSLALLVDSGHTHPPA